MSNDTELENSQESLGEPTPEKEETLTAEELIEKNKQLYARLKKAEEENKILKKETRSTQSEGVTQSDLPNETVERLTLKVDGYNDEEVAEIMKLGGIKALQNPIVKKAVERMREDRALESAQVTEGGQQSDITRKYSLADLRKMSAKEIEEKLTSA